MFDRGRSGMENSGRFRRSPGLQRIPARKVVSTGIVQRESPSSCLPDETDPVIQLTMNTSFDGIYGAILGLVMRCLGNGRWSQSMQPQRVCEIVLVSVFAPGHRPGTESDVLVRQETLLRKAIIEYPGTAFYGAGDFVGAVARVVGASTG